MECKRVRVVMLMSLTDHFDRFRWVSCQLEVLKNCRPENIQQVLYKLPASLDETFERILRGIKVYNQNDAYRLLQCLCVAARPLHVGELAEILALDFDESYGATPRLNEDWRWDDPQQAVLTMCSGLVMLVDNGHSCDVQFSHFSVKQFLTSSRPVNPLRDISWFHIPREDAHTTLTRACFATLLRLDGSLSNDQVEHRFPLVRYASQHWVEHAQFGKVSLRIGDGMQRLFDPTKPYFSSWLRLYNIDDHWNQSGNAWVARGSPLYYASLCGFLDLAEYIIKGHPEQVNATGGRRHNPLAAALHKGHFNVAELLHLHDASLNATDYNNQTLLQVAAVDGRSEVAQWLLERGAVPNSQRGDHGAPIHLATAYGHPEVIRALLKPEYGVDIDSADKGGRTPLHLASSTGKAEIVRLLLDHDANPNAVDKDGCTPLSLTWTTEVERLLLDYGASPGEEGRSSEGGIEEGEV